MADGRHWLRQSWLDLRGAGPVVLPVHEAVAAHFVGSGIPEDNIRVLRNPATPWRTERVLAERNRDVFFVGRLEEDKGSTCSPQQPTGRSRPALDRRWRASPACSHVPGRELHGWQSRERIAELIGNARMLVLPCRCRETFGLVAVEALLSGVPVVISRFAAIAGEVRARGFGVSATPTTRALTALLVDLARETRGSKPSAAVPLPAPHLAPTPAEWCDGLLQIYADLLGDRASRASSGGRRMHALSQRGDR